MGKIVVIHFSDCFYPRINGVTISINTISKALSQRNVYNIIVSPSYEKSNTLKVESYEGIDLIRVPSKTFIFNKEDRFMLFNYNYQLYKLINDMTREYHKIVCLFHNIMNSYFIGNSIVNLLKKNTSKKVIKICYYHTLWEYYLHYIPLPKFISLNLLRILERKVLKSMDYIMVANDYVKDMVIRKIGSLEKIIVNPLPIDTIFLENLNSTQTYKGKYFLYVGRIGKEKNLYFLLDVFCELTKFDNSFRLYLVGDGPERENLISYSKSIKIDDKISFLGYRPQREIVDLYKYSQGVIFVSKTETLGLVVLEAMSCGAIVFTLNVPPFNTIISNLHNGVLVDKEEKEYFAKKILDVISDRDLSQRIKRNAMDKSKISHPITFTQKLLNIVA